MPEKMDGIIKEAAFEDAAVVARLAIKMWNNHSIEELTKDFEKFIEYDCSAVFIISVDDKVIGFAQCSLRHDYVEGTQSSPVGYLEGVFVEQDYRGRGYARKLLKNCEEWSKKKGCTEFASDCELDNAQSLAFHLKTGFDETNRIICFTKTL